jgi:cystathionine beta-lyase/cystathionine gamma-synthase
MHKQALDIYGEYEYRTANPTRTALEMHYEYWEWRKRTGLFIWVSGNRLFDAGLKPGDEVIAMDDLYGNLQIVYENL